MANKMLGKVVAGAALGGASLLVFTPGIAFADGHHDNEGKVYAKPHVVKAGDTVKLLEICPEPQEHAYVWSKVTGKVKLKPAQDRTDRRGEEGSRDHDKGNDHDKGRDHDGKDETPKPRPTDDGTGRPQPPADGGQPPANGGQPPANGGQPPANGGQPPAGQGGGADAAGNEGERDWKGYEHGQDAEGDRGGREDRKDHKGYGSNGYDHEEYGSNGYDHEEYGSNGYGHEGYGSDERGSDRGDHRREDRKDHDGRGSDERGGKGHDNGWSDEESEGYGKDKDRWEHKRDFVYYGEAEVSENAKPGRYKLKGSCGEGELVVLPRGGVDGGDGGVGAGTDRGLAAGGASLLGAAALGGLVLMRRRRTDESFV
ncbi:hypothetical protein ACGF7U_24530 [Micromonospora sp. NPDC047670]|uniref:hypothetical protein n=1 Tax=Micromonospora sp. NPDC047670 TaxID=3364252 RepID=UPI00371DCAF4